jgi:hypothetical protein
MVVNLCIDYMSFCDEELDKYLLYEIKFEKVICYKKTKPLH